MLGWYFHSFPVNFILILQNRYRVWYCWETLNTTAWEGIFRSAILYIKIVIGIYGKTK